MHNACAALVLSCVLGAIPAAADETTIGILRFQSPSTVPENITTSVEQFVYSAFTSEQRFRVLERSRLDAIQVERVIQETNAVAEPTALRDLGAQYVVLGEVTRVEATQQHGSQGGTFYSATVSYGLRIIDVATGTVSHSEVFSSGRGNPLANLILVNGAPLGSSGDTRTQAGAVDIALQQTRKQLESFIDKVFAISGQLLSVESTDGKGVPQTVLVSLGVADGVDRKSVLNAYTSQTLDVNGKALVRKKPVAELVFVESQGDHLSLFKVRKGSPDLSAATGSGTPVFVEFRN